MATVPTGSPPPPALHHRRSLGELFHHHTDTETLYETGSHAQKELLKRRKKLSKTSFSEFKAEVTIAKGISELYKAQHKKKRLGGMGPDVEVEEESVTGRLMHFAQEVLVQRAANADPKQKGGQWTPGGEGGSSMEAALLSKLMSAEGKGLVGDAIRGVERRRASHSGAVERPDPSTILSGVATPTPPTTDTAAASTATTPVVPYQSKPHSSMENTVKTLEKLALGAAAVSGAVVAIDEVAERRRKKRQSRSADRQSPSPTPLEVDSKSDRLPLNSTPLVVTPPSLLKTPSPPPPAQHRVFISQLSATEHFLVRHAAAALLLREPDIRHAVGGAPQMLHVLSTPKMGEPPGPTTHLFGVSLRKLVKYESTDSHHGAGPEPLRIPIFLDHIITAMKQMDVTVEGILRKSGSLQVVSEVMNALDRTSDGYTVDLAGVDPVTLTTIFKRWLNNIPDPILTGNCFELLLAASHISNPTAKRRVMRLVICLMPKTSRDVSEVVFLFLHWLSTFAHISVKVGNRMDLTNIATKLPYEMSKALRIDVPKKADSKSLIDRFLQAL